MRYGVRVFCLNDILTLITRTRDFNWFAETQSQANINLFVVYGMLECWNNGIVAISNLPVFHHSRFLLICICDLVLRKIEKLRVLIII